MRRLELALDPLRRRREHGVARARSARPCHRRRAGPRNVHGPRFRTPGGRPNCHAVVRGSGDEGGVPPRDDDGDHGGGAALRGLRLCTGRAGAERAGRWYSRAAGQDGKTAELRRGSMCDSEYGKPFIVDTSMTRRSAVLALSSAAVMAGLPTAAFAANVTETDVMVPTPDGSADAVLFHPAGSGSWPAVLMWPDILGLRPVFREMGRRLAAEGYTVLVPNPFYRTKRAPIVTGAFDFNDPKQRDSIMSLRSTLTDTGIDKDAATFIAFLDKQKQTNRRKGAGVQGYCFSGPFAFQTAAVRSDRIRAVGTFHGGGLVTKDAKSPHLLIPRTKASFVVAIARNDDQKQPDAKDTLKATFAAAKRPATVEVYPADHGWCVAGGGSYNEVAAERAWAELLRLYRTNLI